MRFPPAKAASSTSMTNGFGPFISVSASAITPENSGSTRMSLGAAMIELERDRGRIEPDVERVEHRARHRHREMRLVHRGDVRQHRRDRIAAADAAACEIRRKAPAARIGLRPGEDAALIDRADMVGIDRRGARQEAQRRQRPRNWPASCPVRCCIGFARRSSATFHLRRSLTGTRSKSTGISPRRSGPPAAPADSPRSAGCPRRDRRVRSRRRHNSRRRTAARTGRCPSPG